ncbi:MAG: hypothetical protein NZ482_01875 [Gloeomargarita sp. SKYG98]|nr:hypothetical protein [Gloeomargarita sp. SKYG98]
MKVSKYKRVIDLFRQDPSLTPKEICEKLGPDEFTPGYVSQCLHRYRTEMKQQQGWEAAPPAPVNYPYHHPAQATPPLSPLAYYPAYSGGGWQQVPQQVPAHPSYHQAAPPVQLHEWQRLHELLGRVLLYLIKQGTISPEKVRIYLQNVIFADLNDVKLYERLIENRASQFWQQPPTISLEEEPIS